MTSSSASDDARTASGIVLAYALFGGIFAWMAHLIAQAGVVGYACDTGRLWPFHVLTVVTLAMTAHVLLVSWRIAHPGQASVSVSAARILGWMAVVFNVFNVVLIVAEWVPVLVLDPCAMG